MFESLFGNATYSGSALQKLIAERQTQNFAITPERAKRFADAFLIEHPTFFQVAGSVPNVEAEQMAAMGLSNVAVLFTISSEIAAGGYGQLIDQYSETNAGMAYCLGRCLSEYARALNIPDKHSDYHGGFPAGLLLWDTVRFLGATDSWKRLFAEMTRTAPRPLDLDDDLIEMLRSMAPQASKAAADQALQNVRNVQQLHFLPDFLQRANLSLVLTNPDSDPPLPPGGCSFCNGRGVRSSCSACMGRGYISRLTMKGEMETTTCLVCYGSGHARCDQCGGTGRG